MKHDDGKGNITWDREDFIIPEHDTPEYWEHFRQTLKDNYCLIPPSVDRNK